MYRRKKKRARVPCIWDLGLPKPRRVGRREQCVLWHGVSHEREWACRRILSQKDAIEKVIDVCTAQGAPRRHAERGRALRLAAQRHVLARQQHLGARRVQADNTLDCRASLGRRHARQQLRHRLRLAAREQRSCGSGSSNTS